MNNHYSLNNWADVIPSTWKSIKLKNAIIDINDKNNPIKFTNILSLTNKLGVVPYEEKGNQGNISKEDLSQYKLAYKNTVIINSMNLKIGSVGLSNYDGCVSPVYYVLGAKNDTDIRFINYLFQSEFQKYLGKFGKGIMEIREKIPMYDVLHSYIPFPSNSNQIRIADYLDNQCKKISSVIENNLKEIDLLNDYKSKKINEIINQGLDNEAEMKDSNIEYIGHIPKNYDVKKLKFIANSFSKGNGITKDEVFEDGDIQCIRYGEIYSKYDRSFTKAESSTKLDVINSLKFIHKGDLLFTATGELVEEIGKNIVYLGDEPCIAGGDIIIVEHSENPVYLNYALNDISSQSQKSYGKAKLKVVHISAREIGNIYIPLPSRDIQDKVASYLDDFCSKIDRVINYRRKIIEKLEEYRKSLIYEVVTGKKEV